MHLGSLTRITIELLKGGTMGIGMRCPGAQCRLCGRSIQVRIINMIRFFPGSQSIDEEPLILLSHIPLSRPSTASCGPLREKGKMHRNVGDGFQSLLGKQTTQFLLDTLRPSLIFRLVPTYFCP